MFFMMVIWSWVITLFMLEIFEFNKCGAKNTLFITGVTFLFQNSEYAYTIHMRPTRM